MAGIQEFAKQEFAKAPKASRSGNTKKMDIWFAARAVFTFSETKSEIPEKQKLARSPAKTDFHQKEKTKTPEAIA